MSVTPKDTMWVGERLMHAGVEIPEDDPLVVQRPELFNWPEPVGPEPSRRGPGRPSGSKNKPKSASDG